MMTPWILAAFAAVPTPSLALHDRVEKAVLANDLKPLLAIRKEISTALDATSGKNNLELQYLLGYVNWRAGALMSGIEAHEDEREALLEEAQQTLEVLVEAQPKDAEAHALLASVLGFRIGSSMFRGMRLGPRSSSLFDKALALQPDNPRVALLRGVRALYTPSMFGGGDDVAAAELDRAHMLFEKGSMSTWPNWGRVDVFAWRGQLAAKRGDHAGARALYERALVEVPNARWIKDTLLPALKKRPTIDD